MLQILLMTEYGDAKQRSLVRGWIAVGCLSRVRKRFHDEAPEFLLKRRDITRHFAFEVRRAIAAEPFRRGLNGRVPERAAGVRGLVTFTLPFDLRETDSPRSVAVESLGQPQRRCAPA
jgi:hypothetical protein